jgi:hypothetical protein
MARTYQRSSTHSFGGMPTLWTWREWGGQGAGTLMRPWGSPPCVQVELLSCLVEVKYPVQIPIRKEKTHQHFSPHSRGAKERFYTSSAKNYDFLYSFKHRALLR